MNSHQFQYLLRDFLIQHLLWQEEKNTRSTPGMGIILDTGERPSCKTNLSRGLRHPVLYDGQKERRG